MSTLTFTEEEGIEAIKYLQGLADVPETDEQATRGWNSMSQHDKEFTIEFARRMKKEKDPAGTVQGMIKAVPEAQVLRQNALDRNAREAS